MSLQNVFSTELMPFRMQNLTQIVQSQCPRMFTAKRNSAENFFQQQNCYLRLYKQVGPTLIQTNWYLRLYKQVGTYAYTNKLVPTPIQGRPSPRVTKTSQITGRTEFSRPSVPPSIFVTHKKVTWCAAILYTYMHTYIYIYTYVHIYISHQA